VGIRDFDSGQVGFVRMELKARMVQNSLIGNENWEQIGSANVQKSKNCGQISPTNPIFLIPKIKRDWKFKNSVALIR
jgi:hypothetical protein